ncbi:uncharacterized protein LOC120258643 [Dioscorea cayenensis subsp. rotundata]|uniref:Uncharacterized protein LOC120258643 n=1 Tax=Dioscorea cayennensis subsp. rotundata TaxID=55577 RepID=A0AB40B424_DIOCR|nr:uncharacterized protein LOC120258643 [Dioscorea cayenensis subsp. rotundata]
MAAVVATVTVEAAPTSSSSFSASLPSPSQESELDSVTPAIWRSLGGNHFDDYYWSPSQGSSDGMIIGWNSSTLKGKLIHSSKFCLTVEFHNSLIEDIWLCTSVYGPNDKHLKQSFWNEIRSSNGGKTNPWVICGDFNAIFSTLDKNQGVPFREDITQAQALMRDLNLVEPPSVGFGDLIQTWWKEVNPQGCGAFILSKKLSHTRAKLRAWANTSFGSIKLWKLNILREIENLDVIKDTRCLSESELQRDSELKQTLHNTLNLEETYWRQRSRVTWLKEGDSNTKFFHAVANGRRNHFYFGSSNLERINWANIVLIPKTNSPELVSDFRPISLINSSLKIISKVLASKLGKVIDSLIETHQSVFIAGRCILDNIVAAEETISSLQKRRIMGNIIKVDFAKAFDMVNWDFLLDLLKAHGFGERWIGWIERLMFTSKSSILVNGSVNGFVRHKRDLRHGDPLSPLLFILVVDVLSSLLSNALDSGILYGVPLGSQGKICHLQYVDDLLILTAGGA